MDGQFNTAQYILPNNDDDAYTYDDDDDDDDDSNIKNRLLLYLSDSMYLCCSKIS